MITLDVRRVICNGICNTKIDQLQLALYENEVGWLEIRVDDLFLVDHLDGLEHLSTPCLNILPVMKRIKLLTCCQ